MHNYLVKLNNIKIKSIHGLYESEKIDKQLFEVDIAVSFHKKTCDDKIKKTVDYESLYNIIRKIFNNNSFDLLETLGEKIIDKVFNNYDAENVTVTIRKPGIQFGGNSECVEVSIGKDNE